MMLGHILDEVDLSHETRTEPGGRDFWVRALPQKTYSGQLKRIVRGMLRTSRRRRPEAKTLYRNLLEDMEVWRSESVEGRRYIRRITDSVEEEKEVVEKKEKKKKDQGEGKEGGKAAAVEVIDLEEEEEEEEHRGRGKGKTRGGGF